MAAEQRKLLEQLMGDQLMGAGAGARGPQLSLTDAKVCRSYIAGTCPHDLFTNTKQDLGTCPRVHSEALKNEYETSEDKQKYGFEFDYMRDLQKYIDDCNRRIDGAQRRLEKTPDEIRQTNTLLGQIAEFSQTIDAGLLEVSILGEEGSVARACEEYFKIRQTKQAREERERELKSLSDTSGPSGHQKLQVCDVCGAYLSRLDNDRRLADHFFGKMHLGYAQMRKTCETLQKDLRGRAPPRPADDGPGPGDRGHRGSVDGGWGGRQDSYGRGRGGGFGGRGGRGRGRW